MSPGETTSASKGNDITVKNKFKDDLSHLERKVQSKVPGCGLITPRASGCGATTGARESIPNVGRRAVKSRHPLVLQGFPVGPPHSGTTSSTLQVRWAGALTSPASRRPTNHRQINDLAVSLPIKTYPSTLRHIYGRYYAEPDQRVKVGVGNPQVKVGAGDRHVTVGAGGLLPRQKVERPVVTSNRKNSLNDSTARYSQRQHQHLHNTYLQLKRRLQHHHYQRQQQLGTQTTLNPEHMLTSHKIPVNPLICRHLALHTLAYRNKARGCLLRQHQTPSTLIRRHQVPDGATGCKSIKEQVQSNYSRSELERTTCSKTDPDKEGCSRVKLPSISSGGEPRHLDMLEYLWVYQGMSRQVLNLGLNLGLHLGLRQRSGSEDRGRTFNMAQASNCCMCAGNAMSSSAALTELSRRQVLISSTPTFGGFWVNKGLINMAKISKINSNKEINEKVDNYNSLFVREGGQLSDSRDSKMLVNAKKKLVVTLPVISRDMSSKDLYSDDRHRESSTADDITINSKPVRVP